MKQLESIKVVSVFPSLRFFENTAHVFIVIAFLASVPIFLLAVLGVSASDGRGVIYLTVLEVLLAFVVIVLASVSLYAWNSLHYRRHAIAMAWAIAATLYSAFTLYYWVLPRGNSLYHVRDFYYSLGALAFLVGICARTLAQAHVQNLRQTGLFCLLVLVVALFLIAH